MKLNLTTKTDEEFFAIKIKCALKREQIEDLEIYYAGFYGYKFNDDSEKEIIERYFRVTYIRDRDIYYTYKSLRHIKLLILEKNALSKILERIIKDSFTANLQDILEWKLSDEITKEIDKEIIKSLISMNSGETLENDLIPFKSR
jgi:hypothetical protein